MSCSSCDGGPLTLSTLSASSFQVVVDHDTDPQAATIEFATTATGAIPGAGDWSAGSWIDDDADTVTDKGSGRSGLFGWLARTPIVGPLTEGSYSLWVRISSGGGEQWVETVDTLLVDD
jgi:hypothetical protein